MMPIEPTGSVELQMFTLSKENQEGQQLDISTGETMNSTAEMNAARRTLYIFIGCFCFAVLSVLYATVKMLMVGFVCPEGFWNLSGCAELKS